MFVFQTMKLEIRQLDEKKQVLFRQYSDKVDSYFEHQLVLDVTQTQ